MEAGGDEEPEVVVEVPVEKETSPPEVGLQVESEVPEE